MCIRDRLAEASGVTIAFERELLEGGFGAQHGEQVPVAAMLTGGEDHGLLATFSGGEVLPRGFVAIGRVVDRRGDETRVLLDGHPFQPRGWDPVSYTHLAVYKRQAEGITSVPPVLELAR